MIHFHQMGLRRNAARLGTTITGALALVLAQGAYAASAGGGALADYTFEVTPLIGINLPYDLWGSSGTLTVYGIRGGYNLDKLGGVGAIETSFLYHKAGSDSAMTYDLGYLYDFQEYGVNAFFTAGFHYSKFSLSIDYDEGHEDDAAYCNPRNCQTDSGTYSGIYVGGGINVPINPRVPVRFGMRFYNNPQLWLLLDMGVSVRF